MIKPLPSSLSILKIKRCLLVGLLVFFANEGLAQRTASVSGNWNNTATWGNQSVPSASDAVIINAGVTVTITSNAVCNSISINNSSNNTTTRLTINQGINLTVGSSNGLITIGNGTSMGNSNTSITELVVDGNLFSGTIDQNPGVRPNGQGGAGNTSLVINSTGAVTSAGNIIGSSTVNGVGNLQGVANLTINSTGFLKLTGTFSTSEFINSSSSTVEYNGVNQTIRDATYHNLILSNSGTKTLPAIASISGNLTLAGTASTTTTANFGIGGNLDIGDGTTLTTGSNFTFSVTGTSQIGGGTSGSLILEGTGTKTFTGIITVASGAIWNETGIAAVNFGSDLINNGTFTANTGTHTFSGTNRLIGGTAALSIANTAISGTYRNGTTLTSSNLSGAGTLTQEANSILNLPGTYTITGLVANTNCPNRVNYSGGDQTVRPINYCNLTLSGTGTKTFQTGTTSILGDFSLSGTPSTTAVTGLSIGGSVNIGTGTTFTGGNFTHTVGSNWIRNGTFIATGSTIDFNGPNAGSIGTSNFQNVTFSGAGVKTATGALAITGNVSVANNFTAGSFTHSVGGNWTRAGTFTATGSTIDFNGSNAASIGTSNFQNVSFSGAGVKTATGALATAGNVSITGNFTAGAFTHTVGGDWTRGGTFTATGSTIDFNGPNAASIGLSNFQNVTFSGAGVKTATGALAIAGNVSISGNFTAGAFTHTVGGDWTRVGTFTATGSTIDFNGIGAASIGTSNFQNVTFSGAGVKTATGALTIAGNISVSNNFTAGAFTHSVGGNWTRAGTFTATGSTIDFNGASAASIGTSNFQNMTFSGAGVKTATGALTIAGNISLSNNFTAGSFTHSVGGSWTRSGTFNAAGSTIDFNGANAASIGTSNFQNITFSGAGAKTATGALTITGNIAIANNFTAGAFTHTVGGNWTKAGTFIATGSTIDFNGASAASIGTSNFQNVTFSGAGVKTATGALSIVGNISISNNFTAGSFTHTVGGNWANSGTFNEGTSTINFNGALAQSIGSSNFNNITFSGAGTKTAGSSLTVAGNVLISTNFSAGSFTHTIGGNWTNSGTFTPNTSTVTFNRNGVQTISSNTFYNLTLISSGDKFFSVSTTIANNFEIEGTAVARLGSSNHSANKLYLGTAGQAASSYGSTASAATFKLPQYFGTIDTGILNVTTSGILCSNGTWLGATSTDWDIASNWCNSTIPDLTIDVIIPNTAPNQPVIGIVGAKTRSLTIESGATLSISGAYLLEVAGSWIRNGTFNPGAISTVEFKGISNPSINSGNFANISFTGTGTITIHGGISVSGNISPVSAKVILSSAQTLTLRSGKTMDITSSGSFTTPGSTSKIILSPGSIYRNLSTSNPRLEVKQLITGAKGWRLIGSPAGSTYATMTSGFETQGFPSSTNPSLQPNLLWWDETDKGTTLQGWRQPTNLSNSVPAARGHYFYVFNGATKPSPVTGSYTDVLPLTMSTTGTEVNLASGIFNFGVTFTARDTNLVAQTDALIEVNQADEGFNLIANPTASMLDWDASTGWTKTNMDASIYVWDPATSSFLTWNGSAGTLGNGRIAPFQGFWVRSNASSPSLQLTGNGAKTLTNKAFYGRTIATEEPALIHLQVNGENLQAESFISFGEDGLEGVDPKDAYQLESLAEDWVLLYTYGSINKKTPLVINHLNSIAENEKVIPLHLAASRSGNPINGSYLMNWTLPTDLPAEVTVTLMDHISKKAIDMRKESAHAFTFEAPKLPNARIGKSFDPLAIPQAVVFQSPYETGEVNPNARKVADKPHRPFTIFISGKPNGEIGYLADLPKLFGPVPNPFSNQTKIKFYLPETQKAEIQITDMLGQVVGSFPSEVYGAGIHELEWIPSTIQIPHGMYVIRLITDRYQMSQKLIKN